MKINRAKYFAFFILLAGLISISRAHAISLQEVVISANVIDYIRLSVPENINNSDDICQNDTSKPWVVTNNDSGYFISYENIESNIKQLSIFSRFLSSDKGCDNQFGPQNNSVSNIQITSAGLLP